MKRLKNKFSKIVKVKLIIGLVVASVFTSCKSDVTTFVNIKDVIGLGILAILLIGFGVILLIDWIQKQFKKLKKK
jgi:hypothetical protein